MMHPYGSSSSTESNYVIESQTTVSEKRDNAHWDFAADIPLARVALIFLVNGRRAPAFATVLVIITRWDGE